MRIGPVAFNPRLALKNLGWDNNVFNEVEDPKQDFTVTAGGLVDWWMRAGDVRLVSTVQADYVYYATYASQRGVNHGENLRIEYRLSRIRPYVLGSYLSTIDRPGYEIETRQRHTEGALGAGLEVRATSKTQLDFSARQTSYAYPSDAVYGDQLLAQTLNRTGRIGSAIVRYVATPLTTLTMLAEYREERYEGSPDRDNDSFRIMPGVQLDPFALIKGSARVGYLHLHAPSPSIPDYSGVVADVNLSYVLLGRTRFSVGVNRDIQFSYDIAESYYVLTGVSGGVRQGLGMGWDVEARGYNQRLAYQPTAGTSAGATGRVDRVQSFGGGVGYRLGQSIRVGFNIDYYRQLSDYYPGYNTLRYGLSSTYEF